MKIKELMMRIKRRNSFTRHCGRKDVMPERKSGGQGATMREETVIKVRPYYKVACV